MVQNKGLIFKEPPVDWPVEGKNLTIEDRGFDLDAQPPKNGITTKNFYVSFDVRHVFYSVLSNLDLLMSLKSPSNISYNALFSTN